jgi:hypothetical protein
MALVGFGMSCLFGGIVVLSTVMAMIQGAAFFFSNWVLLLALAAFLVSWWGLNDVRGSEGTKAGQKLATSGMWISLVTGCGYFAYSYFTGLALSQQAFAFFLTAEDETSGFIPRLQKSATDPVELRRAFLMTLPAPDRSGVRAEEEEKMKQRFDQPKPDGSPGPLSMFRRHELIQAIMHGGAKATVEPLGVKSWKYEQRSYSVSCLVRLKTLEADADVLLTARSSEGETTGQSRQWFVDLPRVGYTSIEPTTFGKGMKTLRAHANNHLQQLETKLRKGTKAGAFDRLDRTDWKAADAALIELKPRLTSVFDGQSPEVTWHINVGRDINLAPWERDSEGRLSVFMTMTIMLMSDRLEIVSSVPSDVIVRTTTSDDPEHSGAADVPVLPEWELAQIKFVRVQFQKKTG